MAKVVITLKDAVVIERSAEDTFALFADPEALMAALDVKGVTTRKLGNAQRWVMSHPKKLGDRVIDLSISGMTPPDHMTWQAALRGFEIETDIRFAPEEPGTTRLRLVTKVRAASLRAKLMAPILKLGHGRLKKGLRKGLRQIAGKLHEA